MRRSAYHELEQRDATTIVAKHLAGLRCGEAPDIDSLAAAHPEHAAYFRALCVELNLNNRSPDAGERMTTDSGQGTGEDSRCRAFIRQLESRGPAHTRYAVVGEIGRGGMGVVHQVYDMDGRRSLAMKVLRGGDFVGQATDDHSSADRRLMRFLEEAQITCQLDHPGIVPVHEIGIDEARNAYFTMKQVKGDDLRAVLAKVRRGSDDSWNPTRLLGVILRACEAMAFAHDKGVIHRDLKPSNIMVGSFGETYVMDWGVARVLNDTGVRDLWRAPTGERQYAAGDVPRSAHLPLLTADGHIVGTPAYMGPEQAAGLRDRIGPHTDVYAMGAILYEALSGQMPYVPPGASVSQSTILTWVVQGPPESIRKLSPDAPGELVAICEKAMNRAVEGRYANMTALANDLRAFLEGRVVSAYESGAWAQLKKWISRNKALSATAGVALAAVLSLTCWAFIERGKSRSEAIRADMNAALASKRASDALRERDNVLRLSDARRLSELRAQVASLWPAYEDRVPAISAWLDRAGALLMNLDGHEKKLAELRAAGIAKDTFLNGHESADAALKELHRDYDFGPDVDAQWWHDALRDLVIGLHAIQEDTAFGDTIASVEACQSFARSVPEQTITGAAARAAWAAARAAIRAHPKYGGLDVPPQLGLLPIGPDPESTLWEFWHVQSGSRPERDEGTGHWLITGDVGLVFVLIPGGNFWLGAQRTDEAGRNYDSHADPNETSAGGPVEVALSAYFLSKYELTQGQWLRACGRNPSYWAQKYAPLSSLSHPVDQVSWHESVEFLRRLGLQLPTETQWERACRAGTSSVWSFGDDALELSKYGNANDKTFAQMFGTELALSDAYDDGQGPPTAVGMYQQNLFGLHDMHGNVWEWCLDAYSDDAYESAAARGGGPFEMRDVVNRVYRGGSYYDRARNARSANRSGDTPTYQGVLLGIRPARSIPATTLLGQ